jgi:hypothetical protein
VGADAFGDPNQPSGSGWRVGPVVNKAGAFVYCIAENRFDNGLGLVFALSPRAELNIGLRLTGAHLAKGDAWKVRLKIDNGLARDRQGVAGGPNMLVIANGADSQLYDALSHGDQLVVESPNDTVAFRLKGTGKALHDLHDCTDHARANPPAKPMARIGDATTPQLPPNMAKLLAAAGFTKIGLLPTSAAPPGHGPTDTLWRVGAVTSGYGETLSQPGQTLSGLADSYLARLKPRCRKDFQVKTVDSENLSGGALRTVDVTCGESGKTTAIALTFDLDRGGLFKVFFHEAPATAATEATKARNSIADLLKHLAAQ